MCIKPFKAFILNAIPINSPILIFSINKAKNAVIEPIIVNEDINIIKYIIIG